MDVAAGAPMDGFYGVPPKDLWSGWRGECLLLLASHATRYAVSRRSASAYFSLVCWITCAGSFGPGAVLFQSSVSR